MLLVRREGDAVWLVEALGDFRERFGLRIKSEHELAGHLFFVQGALAEKPVRIGDPERAVGLQDDVVGAVELFALKGIREHFHSLTMGVPAGELPRGLLDDIKSTCTIGAEAGGLGRVLAPDDETGGLGPFEGEAVMMRSVVQRVADPLCPLAARVAATDELPVGTRCKEIRQIAFHERFAALLQMEGEEVIASSHAHIEGSLSTQESVWSLWDQGQAGGDAQLHEITTCFFCVGAIMIAITRHEGEWGIASIKVMAWRSQCIHLRDVDGIAPEKGAVKRVLRLT